MNLRGRIAQHARLWVAVALAAVLIAVFSATVPGFANVGQASAILNALVLVLLVSVGLGLTVMMGELDLSVGAAAVLGSVLVIRFADLGPVLAIVAATAALAAIGAVQGLIIRVTGISSVVFSLATMIVLGGLAYIVADNSTVSLAKSQFPIADSMSARIGIFTPISLIGIVIVALIGIALRYAVLGRELLALGSDRREAVVSGARVGGVTVAVFAGSAGLAGLAGALTGLGAGASSPTSFGTLLISALTAVLLGGVALEGGRGSILGIAMGALSLQVLVTAFALMGLPNYVSDVSVGTLLIVATAAQLGPRFLRIRAGSTSGQSTNQEGIPG